MVESDGEPVRELRQTYHDRIAELRKQSRVVLRTAIDLCERASGSLLGDEPPDPVTSRAQVVDAAGVVGAVDSEVVSLLALESPMARDLRLILAARDVTQIAQLCVGLGLTLSGRSASSGKITPDDGLASLVTRLAGATVELLRQADSAWAGLDDDLAGSVLEALGPARQARREFFAELLKLSGVPVEVALDLGMAARVYDRLIDHAAEIAGRVLFVVTGRSIFLTLAD